MLRPSLIVSLNPDYIFVNLLLNSFSLPCLSTLSVFHEDPELRKMLCPGTVIAIG